MIEPESEADPAALLLQFLMAFGNVIGHGPYYLVEADKHYMNIFGCLVGETAKARKGTSLGYIRKIFEVVDSSWVSNCVKDGLSTGEGLISEVRNSKEGWDSKNQKYVIDDPGVEDKRLFITAPEFSRILQALSRTGNTLSAVIRQGWDSGNLSTITKTNKDMATDAHISIIGHVTSTDLERDLTETETANGFANRFLWFYTTRSKYLPDGGNIDWNQLSPLIQRLRDTVTFAKSVDSLTRDDSAKTLWYDIYYDLSTGKPGLVGAISARAEAQVLRLSCLYALLDCSSVISSCHLEAALAVWQ